MHNVSNPLQACNDIFFRPNGVFRAVAEKDNWSWFPFFIVIVLAIVPTYFYLNFVDFSWYADQIMHSQYGDLSPVEQEQFRQNMTLNSAMIFGLSATVIGFIAINALVAVYLNLATKADKDNLHGFTDWYGFTWWAAMPTVINSLIAMFLILLADDHQLYPSVLAPLSAAYVFGMDMGSSWYGFAQSFRLDNIWGIYLTVVGIKQWTSFTTKKATIIGVAPYVIIWSVWIIIVIS
ncbi:YIP1 family protein [Alteromonas pelagimontana]|uniref:YIP1 family protein n=1 Tax=Alteromonas pelagimontana TaxID=1858656 RepID=A0A6M4M9Q2_9ALTE|nr:Yip1 family protein [Alteromonas pelagimontana]QJR79883.1 YIP1 family protein [Alteromonas pelagimontana]